MHQEIPITSRRIQQELLTLNQLEVQIHLEIQVQQALEDLRILQQDLVRRQIVLVQPAHLDLGIQVVAEVQQVAETHQPNQHLQAVRQALHRQTENNLCPIHILTLSNLV